MNRTKISAEIVADSLSPQGDRLTSLLITFPRIILAEVNTHRMLSKNTSSSRAIPFSKMVESVQNDPFVPMAWQKHHSGMQGSEYLSSTEKFGLLIFVNSLRDTLHSMTGEKEAEKLRKRIAEKVRIIEEILQEYRHLEMTLPEWWLFARDKAVEAASILYVFDVTKQLCNRLLEPFMWTTMLITGPRSGWENFFHLRCPSYVFHDENEEYHFNSKKDVIKHFGESEWVEGEYDKPLKDLTDLDWLKLNKGQAEIHMMELAERIYDAFNESTPIQLKAGEWHIPFNDKIDYIKLGETSAEYYINNPTELVSPSMWAVKVSTAMSARTSYTVVGDERGVNYVKMIGLHDNLLDQEPPHSSPLEHCAKAMSDVESYLFNKGKASTSGWDKSPDELHFTSSERGWCNNFKGFIPYRYLIDNKLKV